MTLRDFDGRELTGYRHDLVIYQRRSSWWLVWAGLALVILAGLGI